MDRLSPNEVVAMFLALGVLLAAARVLGEVAKRLNQPAVLGEIVAGLLLGPTLLGAVAPGVSEFLFPHEGTQALMLDGLTILAVTLFLLVAGMEVDLSTIWRQGKLAIAVSASGIIFPFALGFTAAWYGSEFLGRGENAEKLVFALFFATALSITSLPIIAKILMDLNLYRTDLGMTIVAAAIFNDLIGWIVFAVILGMMGTAAGHDHGGGMPIGQTITLTLVFAVGTLTVGRWLINWILPWIQAHTSWPGGVLGFALTLALFGAAFTEWIGVHAIFGAFMIGVALGDSNHLRSQTRATIDRFISFIFAPLFFASIGLTVDFVAHFDWIVVPIVLVIPYIGKVIGCGLGGHWAGLPWREAFAVGFGMSSCGAMGIILGLLAMQAGVIDERLFVALVVMALVTSIVSGPMIQRLLRQEKPTRFVDYLTGKTFVATLEASDRWAAIRELSNAAAAASAAAEIDSHAIASAVAQREQIMGTGVSHGVAVPHARLARLESPVVAVGLSRRGVDFDAPDGEPARLIFLILTPLQDHRAQLDILSDIMRSFEDPSAVEKVRRAAGYTEFLAWVNSERGEQQEHENTPEIA